MRSGSDSALATAGILLRPLPTSPGKIDRTSCPGRAKRTGIHSDAPRAQSGVTGHLLHPLFVRVLGDTADSNHAAVQVEEEQYQVTNPRQVSTSTVKKSVPASTAR